MLAENALRGTWRMQCLRGTLQVGITLAPTEPATVQQFTVRAALTNDRSAADATD